MHVPTSRGFITREINAMWWMSRWPVHTSISSIRDLFFEPADRFYNASARQQDHPTSVHFTVPMASDDQGDCFSTELYGTLAELFIPLEEVTGQKFWHEHTYEEAKQMAAEVRAFRPAPQPPVDPFPEPTSGRPSERTDHEF